MGRGSYSQDKEIQIIRKLAVLQSIHVETMVIRVYNILGFITKLRQCNRPLFQSARNLFHNKFQNITNVQQAFRAFFPDDNGMRKKWASSRGALYPNTLLLLKRLPYSQEACL